MMEFRVGCWVQRSFGQGWCSPRLVREENQQVQGSNPRRSVCVPLRVLLVLGGGWPRLVVNSAILLRPSQGLGREACATMLGCISDILAYLFLPPTALMAQYLLQNEVTEVSPQAQLVSCPVMDVPVEEQGVLTRLDPCVPHSQYVTLSSSRRVNPHLALHLTSPSPQETRNPMRTRSTTLPSASIASPDCIGVSTDASATG